MLSRTDYIRQSLETHLFFARIMKEHAFFLQVGFTPKDNKYIKYANELRMAFDDFLEDCVELANGVISKTVIASGEIITQYTLEAEKLTEFYTGVNFRTKITQKEKALVAGNDCHPTMERKVFILNRRALSLLDNIIRFKTNILNEVLSCKMFTLNYPLLIEHILREARLYRRLIQKLQARETINVKKEMLEQEAFWNQIMGEHAKFIRGLLDPSEEELFDAADRFGREFDRLTDEAKDAMDRCTPVDYMQITDESLRATKNIRDFKAQGTEGLLDCKIKSIILPLLGDHVLREANHYLNLLKIFRQC
ncbi:DUF2935 family protein [Herbinix hemicellulosilytica]|uniref:DUF2935 family protein n=1 Tax=Herbinix hemicellulosilytica TaxID=1564487 RepID=A0A0H5SDU1_HERHM|nr:DUF2935 domain-containing protein [Herbinix hemicellulosilytica]RBP60304.1 DUF2935 family protein [Herbinix hemicellulosilytica]CRZ33554.1 hypothetical protein HHT355_0346 [Herbinix hemicellulosilytica]